MCTIGDYECSDPPICDPAYDYDDSWELCEYCDDIYYADDGYCPNCRGSVIDFLHEKRGYSYEILECKPTDLLHKIADRYI